MITNLTNNGANDTNYTLKLDDRSSFEVCHLLLVGQTGSGKSYALQHLLLQIINKELDYHLYFNDPKLSDIYNIGNIVSPETTAEDNFQSLVNNLEKVQEKLLQRQKELQSYTSKTLNHDYRDFKMKPIILIFDEFAYFSSQLAECKPAERSRINSMLKGIVLKGRQLGVFLWVIMQKSDAKLISTDIRDNLPLKIVLGNAEKTTYETAFGSGIEIPSINLNVGEGFFSHPKISNQLSLISFPYLSFMEKMSISDLYGK